MEVQDDFAWKRCIKIYRFLQNWINLSYLMSLFCILAFVRHRHWLTCSVSSLASLVGFKFWKILLDYAVQSLISNRSWLLEAKWSSSSCFGGEVTGLRSLVCPCFPAFPYFYCRTIYVQIPITYFRDLASRNTYRNNFKPSSYT